MDLRKILIVSDSKENQHIFSSVFEGEYELFYAQNSQDAIQLFPKINNLAVVLLDLNIAKKYDFAFLKYMEQEKLTKDIPIILLSDHSQIEDEITAFEHGAMEMMRYPFIPDIVKRRVENIIELSLSRNSLEVQLSKSQIELEEMKKYDHLSGFLNMTEFLAVADNLCISLDEEARKQYTFIYTNIHNFKYYNVKYGMEKGDDVLRFLANAILQLNGAQLYTRFGQDHYVILTNEPKQICIQNVQKLNHIFENEYGAYNMQLKIGMYSCENGFESAHNACELAKIACDEIKIKGDYLNVFTEQLRQKFQVKDYILLKFEEALKEDYIKVYYQPVMRTINGKICGLEALARWDDPKIGILSPASFIPTLEENHLIQKLDLYVLRKVCETMQERANLGLPTIPVSINLSRIDFKECDIFKEVEKIVLSNNVPRDMINIEVTETALMSDPIQLKEDIRRFRDGGYHVWMDDFGSGYSSLNVLKDYSFDEIKLDMKFMSSFDDKAKKIVTSIIDMAKSIGLETLAEGVETQEQYEFLKNIGCEKIQGYYLSKPLPLDQLDTKELFYPENVETRVCRRYYRRISHIRLLTDKPLAIIEWNENQFSFLFANQAFKDVLFSSGMTSIQGALDNMNLPSSTISRLFKNMAKTIRKEAQEREFVYSIRNCFIKVIARCISQDDHRSAFHVSIINLTNLEEEHVREQLDEVSKRLVGFFDAIFLGDLTKNTFEVIRHGNYNIDNADYTLHQKNTLDGALQACTYYIHPSQREEYLAFTNISTLLDRIKLSSKPYITHDFKTLEHNGAYVWKGHTILYMSDTNQCLYCSRTIPLTDEGSAIRDIYAQSQNTDVVLKGLQKWIQQGIIHSHSINMFWKDKDRKFVGANENFLNTYGFHDVSEIIGKTDEDMGWHIQDGPFANDEINVLEHGDIIQNHHGMCNIHGVAHNILASKEPIYEDGNIVGLVGYFLDADDILDRLAEQNTSYNIDTVTGLMSPQGLINAIAKFAEEWTTKSQNFAFIRLSVTEYLRATKTYGEIITKELFKAVGQFISNYVGIRGTCARLYAGNFAIMMRCDDKEEVRRFVQSLLDELNDIHTLLDYSVTLNPSVEITFADESSDLIEMLGYGVGSTFINAKEQLTWNVDLSQIYHSYEDLSEMVIIVDMDTNNLLYANRSARERYGLFNLEHLKHKKCYELLQGKTKKCKECTDEYFLDGKDHVREMFNPHLNNYIRIKEQLLRCNGQRILIQIAYELSDEEPNQPNQQDRILYQLSECTRLAFEEIDYENGIQGLVEQLGLILHAERTYIFELFDDKWSNTYEWCAKGVTPQKDNLQDLPLEAAGTWYNRFNLGQHVTIRNVEELKDNDLQLYNYLVPQDIHSIIVAPLFKDDTLIGFYGIDNPPQDLVELVSTSIKQMTNSIEILLHQRDIHTMLHTMSYRDTLSELGNRHAVERMYKQLDKRQSVGVVFCDICGLKLVNDTLGHAAGDQILLQARDLLQQVFGEYDIFRWGGDEMLVLASGIERNIFEEKCEFLKKLCKEENALVAIGYIWSQAVSTSVKKLVNLADEKMYEDKNRLHVQNDLRKIYRNNDYLKNYIHADIDDKK